jgi:hypothetical protein
VGEPAHRTEQNLTGEERSLLDAAQRALDDAVAAYARLDGGVLESGRQIPVANADEVRSAQEAIEVAEDRLWQLREELLAWTRPPWAPRAALVADWFCDEDAIYDDQPEATAS